MLTPRGSLLIGADSKQEQLLTPRLSIIYFLILVLPGIRRERGDLN